MKNKNTLYYVLAMISIGYLVYNFVSRGLEYGMMNHHYGYYNYPARDIDILNTVVVFLAYIVLILSAILILKEKTNSNNKSLEILNNRLSKGEISIEEYKTLVQVIMESRWKYDAYMDSNYFCFILLPIRW